MADPAAAPVVLAPAVSAPEVKPGWQTSEFWLKLLALLLTALYASGVIPTTGPVATVAAIAATILGALGYAVVRSNLKKAAITGATPANDNAPSAVAVVRQAGFVSLPLLAVLAIAGVALLSLGGCGAKTHAAEKALIDCEADAVKAKVPDLLPTVTTILANGSVDWKQQLDALVQYAGVETIACTVKAAGTLFAKGKVGGPVQGDGANRAAVSRADEALTSHHWTFKASTP